MGPEPDYSLEHIDYPNHAVSIPLKRLELFPVPYLLKRRNTLPEKLQRLANGLICSFSAFQNDLENLRDSNVPVEGGVSSVVGLGVGAVFVARLRTDAGGGFIVDIVVPGFAGSGGGRLGRS